MKASRSSASDWRQSFSKGWIGIVKKPSFMCFSLPLFTLAQAGLRLQSRRRNAGDRAGFVVVRRITGNADRADCVALDSLDQHAARRRHHAALAYRAQRGDEHRVFLNAFEQAA